MKSSILYIKNMVCDRCIKVIQDEFAKLHLSIVSIELGKVEVTPKLSSSKLKEINEILNTNGFEMVYDRKSKIINEIKTIIIEKVHHSTTAIDSIKISEHLSNVLHFDYSYLSKLFSSSENITIEKYIILQKVERVKELLNYNELTISQIAYTVGYSSAQHLSNQFKKITGQRPSEFKKLTKNVRNPLDKVQSKNDVTFF